MTWWQGLQAGLRFALLTAVTLSAFALGGCGQPPDDPTAKRSDVQSEQLRSRLRRVQGAV